MEGLHRFIAHGLRVGIGEDRFADTEDRALVILDPAGRLVHLSAEARRLLLMALLPRWAPDVAMQMRLDLLPELRRLCALLAAVFAGDVPPAQPVLRRHNGWGEFVLRAYWFGVPPAAAPTQSIGVTIERREPRSLRLLRRIEALPLTQREKLLCLLLARGHDTDGAARVMGAAHTAIAHRRNLYHKLGVPNRLALIERLHDG